MLTLHPISASHPNSYVLNISTSGVDLVRLAKLTIRFFSPCGKLKKLFLKSNRVLTNLTLIISTLEAVKNNFLDYKCNSNEINRGGRQKQNDSYNVEQESTSSLSTGIWYPKQRWQATSSP